MASGDDPTADYMNVMGFQGLTNPNPYLEFTGQIPMAGYMGTPTDAAGNPIQSYLQAQAQHDAWTSPPAAAQGTTLNSTPATGALSPATVPQGLSQPAMGAPSVQGGLQAWGAATPAQRVAAMPQAVYSTTGGNADKGSFGGLGPIGFVQGSGIQGQGQPAAAAPAAAPTNPIDMRQAYLSALANPGKVTTPGAQILPGTSITGPVGSSQPSVLQAFLAAHPQGGTAAGAGPGGFSNAGFFNTLKQLQAGGQT